MLVAEIPAMSTSNRFSVGLYSVCVKAPVVRNVTVSTLHREETCTCVNCPSIAAAASIVLMAHSMESIPTSCINFSFILFLLTLPAVFRCVAASLTQPRKRISPPPFGGYCYCPMGSARIIYKCLLHSLQLRCYLLTGTRSYWNTRSHTTGALTVLTTSRWLSCPRLSR